MRTNQVILQKAKQTKFKCHLHDTQMSYSLEDLHLLEMWEPFFCHFHPHELSLSLPVGFGHLWWSAIPNFFLNHPSSWVFLQLWPPGDCVLFGKVNKKVKAQYQWLKLTKWRGWAHPQCQNCREVQFAILSRNTNMSDRTPGGALWMWQAGGTCKQSKCGGKEWRLGWVNPSQEVKDCFNKKRLRLGVELPLPVADILSHGVKAILSTVFFGIVFWRWTKGTMYLSEKGFQESSVPLLLEMSSAILVSCKASVLPPVCEWKHMLAELGVSPVSTYQTDKWNWMSIKIQPLNK